MHGFKVIKNLDGGKDHRRIILAKYSVKEKRAYDAGKAYGAAKAGKRCRFKTKKEEKSFLNGLSATKKRGGKRK